MKPSFFVNNLCMGGVVHTDKTWWSHVYTVHIFNKHLQYIACPPNKACVCIFWFATDDVVSNESMKWNSIFEVPESLRRQEMSEEEFIINSSHLFRRWVFAVEGDALSWSSWWWKWLWRYLLGICVFSAVFGEDDALHIAKFVASKPKLLWWGPSSFSVLPLRVYCIDTCAVSQCI